VSRGHDNRPKRPAGHHIFLREADLSDPNPGCNRGAAELELLATIIVLHRENLSAPHADPETDVALGD